MGSNAISWQAEELLLGPLKKMEKQKDNMPNFVWIIDALDECSAEKERVELVTALCSLHDVAPWLKIFITSRPNKDIHSAFTKAEQSCSITHNDMMDLQDTSKDIEHYLEHCLSDIAEKQDRTPYGGWLSDEQKSVLLMKASKLFVWVSTMHKYLINARDFEASIQNILDAMPSSYDGDEFQELHRLYSTVLEGADTGNHAANKKFIGNLLGAIHLTSRHSALPPTALAYLLDTNEKNVNGTLADLEAVLLKDSSDHTIRVYHPSFLDYLGGNHLPSGLHYSGEELNAMIMKRCLKVLSEGLRFNICQLETSYVANNDLEDLQSRIKDNISPMLKYASLYWVDHLQDGKGGWSVQTQQTFESLLNGPKIIYWIEVLTLFGMVTQALFIMEKLKGTKYGMSYYKTNYKNLH